MGFLDNLESNLDSLERSNERDDGSELRRRESERTATLAAAPFADALRSKPFAMELLNHATRIGFGQRVKVSPAWAGSSLALTARERRLELRPTAEGIIAVFSMDGEEKATQPVDLDSDPASLAERWLSAG